MNSRMVSIRYIVSVAVCAVFALRFDMNVRAAEKPNKKQAVVVHLPVEAKRPRLFDFDGEFGVGFLSDKQVVNEFLRTRRCKVTLRKLDFDADVPSAKSQMELELEIGSVGDLWAPYDVTVGEKEIIVAHMKAGDASSPMFIQKYERPKPDSPVAGSKTLTVQERYMALPRQFGSLQDRYDFVENAPDQAKLGILGKHNDLLCLATPTGTTKQNQWRKTRLVQGGFYCIKGAFVGKNGLLLFFVNKLRPDDVKMFGYSDEKTGWTGRSAIALKAVGGRLLALKQTKDHLYLLSAKPIEDGLELRVVCSADSGETWKITATTTMDDPGVPVDVALSPDATKAAVIVRNEKSKKGAYRVLQVTLKPTPAAKDVETQDLTTPDKWHRTR